MRLFIKRQVPIAICILMGVVLCGYGFGWTAPIVEKLKSEGQTTLPKPLTDVQASWAGSLMPVASIIGPNITGHLANVIGRKPCIISGAILILISFIMVIFTGNVGTIYALRAIKGLGVGIVVVNSILYLGETSSTELRGPIISLIGVTVTFGTLIIYSIGPFISYAATGYVGVAISVMYLAGLLSVPESPIYWVIKGEDVKAVKILDYLGRGDETDLIKLTKLSIEESRQSKYRWIQLFTQKSNRKATFILVVLTIFQLLSGYAAITFYATTIFELAGSSAVLAVYFYLEENNPTSVESMGWIPLATLIIFNIFYAGFGTIPYILVGEMFSINVRSVSTALTNTVAGITSFLVTAAFGYLILLGGHFVFGIFAAGCALAFVFIAVFVPETKGKSLAEIEAMLSK